MKKTTSVLVLVFLLSLANYAYSQNVPNPPTINGPNVWIGDNYENVCTTRIVGSTFTPRCAVNLITITGAGQTIAVPQIVTPTGLSATSVAKSVELRISYSGTFLPVLPSGYIWPNNTPPGQCNGTSAVTGCLSASAGLTDWIECRTIDATHIGCGAPLTAMGTTTFRVVTQNSCIGPSACTTTATNMTGADLIVGCIGYWSSGGGSISLVDSLANPYTVIYSTVNPVNNKLTGALWYKQAPAVSSSMTFSTNEIGNVTSPVLTVMGFSGSVTNPLDKFTNTAATATAVTTLSPGSLTPSAANELLVTCLTTQNGTPNPDPVVTGIASPFILGPVANAISVTNQGSALAYQIQSPGPTTQNPAWVWTNAVNAIAGQAIFK
jgi:hypothetical protein